MTWGTNIVGGTKPGAAGEHLGLPYFSSVREAAQKLRPDATGVFIPANQAAGAIEEAIEAEIPLVVAVAEHIPLHSMLRIHSILRTQSKTRLVGANSPGIISVPGRCRIGFQPLPCFSEGRVGIAAKSGTLSYEAVASTTRVGLGQSLCIGVGGDIIAGTDLREAVQVLLEDDETEAIALIGEIGGFGEMDAAELIQEYRSRVPNPK
jgi:succinyl-CoA synthetase alpha subunit